MFATTKEAIERANELERRISETSGWLSGTIKSPKSMTSERSGKLYPMARTMLESNIKAMQAEHDKAVSWLNRQ